jgi:uncharacterized protein (DUF1778 family)
VSAQKKTRSVGRPKLPKGHAKAQMLRMRINEADLKLFTKAAKASGQNLSAWIRGTLRDAAQK